MGLKDIIARHRHTIDRGIEKVGEAANARTGGRYDTHIRKGGDRARAGLDHLDPEHDQPRHDTDRPTPGAPDPP